MPPVIRISDANWKRLQQWAVPLEDRVDDVLARVLDAAEPNHRIQGEREVRNGTQSMTREVRRRSGSSHLPQGEYRPVILRVLKALGGRGRTDEVCDRVFEDLRPRLLPGDFVETSGGEVFYRNCTRWERDAMVKAGLLTTSSPRGVWELSELGRKEAAEIG